MAVQAVGGILSGLQSMHTDAYDEAITCPTEETARIAVATQNILREEAHLCDVIDPLGGSYYVETLTDQMEAEILDVMAKIDAAGGMYEAVGSGTVQIDDRAVRPWPPRTASTPERRRWSASTATSTTTTRASPPPMRPDPETMRAHVDAFVEYKAARSPAEVERAITALRRAAQERRPEHLRPAWSRPPRPA